MDTMKLAQVDNSAEGFGGFALEMEQEAKRMEGEMMCRKKKKETKQKPQHFFSDNGHTPENQPFGERKHLFFGCKNFQMHESPPGRTSTPSFSCLNAPRLSFVAWEGLELFCFLFRYFYSSFCMVGWHPHILKWDLLLLQEPVTFEEVAVLFHQGAMGPARPCAEDSLRGCHAGEL